MKRVFSVLSDSRFWVTWWVGMAAGTVSGYWLGRPTTPAALHAFVELCVAMMFWSVHLWKRKSDSQADYIEGLEAALEMRSQLTTKLGRDLADIALGPGDTVTLRTPAGDVTLRTSHTTRLEIIE